VLVDPAVLVMIGAAYGCLTRLSFPLLTYPAHPHFEVEAAKDIRTKACMRLRFASASWTIVDMALPMRSFVDTVDIYGERERAWRRIVGRRKMIAQTRWWYVI
jgi:hypothetical protein